MTARSCWPRRQFLGTVSAGIGSALAAACHDEPMVIVDEPVDPPPETFGYREVVEAYFGDEGLADATFIGSYYADSAGLDSDQAFEAIRATREVVDAANSLDAALDDLDAALQQEFVNLEIVDVAGWTLGRTEVNLCLLAWLVAS